MIFDKKNRKGLVIGFIAGAISLPALLFLTCQGSVDSEMVSLCSRSLLAASTGLSLFIIPIYLILGAIGGVLGAFIDSIYKPGK
jgi:cell division protein FtsX